MGSGEVWEKFVKEWTSYKEGKRTIRETTRRKKKKERKKERKKEVSRTRQRLLAS